MGEGSSVSSRVLDYDAHALEFRVRGVGDDHPGLHAGAQELDYRRVQALSGNGGRNAGRVGSGHFGGDAPGGLGDGDLFGAAEERVARQADLFEAQLRRRRDLDMGRGSQVVSASDPATGRNASAAFAALSMCMAPRRPSVAAVAVMIENTPGGVMPPMIIGLLVTLRD